MPVIVVPLHRGWRVKIDSIGRIMNVTVIFPEWVHYYPHILRLSREKYVIFQ